MRCGPSSMLEILQDFLESDVSVFIEPKSCLDSLNLLGFKTLDKSGVLTRSATTTKSDKIAKKEEGMMLELFDRAIQDKHDGACTRSYRHALECAIWCFVKRQKIY